MDKLKLNIMKTRSKNLQITSRKISKYKKKQQLIKMEKEIDRFLKVKRNKTKIKNKKIQKKKNQNIVILNKILKNIHNNKTIKEMKDQRKKKKCIYKLNKIKNNSKQNWNHNIKVNSNRL
jgi:hypothetical protein